MKLTYGGTHPNKADVDVHEKSLSDSHWMEVTVCAVGTTRLDRRAYVTTDHDVNYDAGPDFVGDLDIGSSGLALPGPGMVAFCDKHEVNCPVIFQDIDEFMDWFKEAFSKLYDRGPSPDPYLKNMG